MAEVVLQEGDTHEGVARSLLAKVGDASAVAWSPRPDVYGGGVYVVADESAASAFVRERQQLQEEQAARIAKAQQFAEERDAKASETGATPAELGFAANIGNDPGAPGTEGAREDQQDADEDDEDEDDDESAETPGESPEAKQTTAQKRSARRAAKTADGASSEEGK